MLLPITLTPSLPHNRHLAELLHTHSYVPSRHPNSTTLLEEAHVAQPSDTQGNDDHDDDNNSEEHWIHSETKEIVNESQL